ncbi:MAG: glycosyltransferase family 4 protein [Clostridia bacterium]|nr:glycosyltransferase family 4 protein [Clostridia bacterium]
MKKVLYVDHLMSGHHKSYACAFLENENTEQIYVFSDIINEIPLEKQIRCEFRPDGLIGYLKWIDQIYRIACAKQVDCIHFLYGDVLYRFFGFGLNKLRRFRVVVTFHQIRWGFIKDWSRLLICRKVAKCVVHTEHLSTELGKRRIRNVVTIDYPKLSIQTEMSREEARDYFDLPEDRVVFAAIGATAQYKGLDILLKAFQNVEGNFHLLIAGKETDIPLKVIDDLSMSYCDRVTKALRFLDENEFAYAIKAADCIVLPYRKGFDGASGPMVEGIWYRKYIIGAEHGSMGDLIKKYVLGETFQTENEEDLAKAINRAIVSERRWSDIAEQYRQNLQIEAFLQQHNDCVY